ARFAALATVWDTAKDAEEFAASLKSLPGRTVSRRGEAVVLLATADEASTEKLGGIGEAMLSALAAGGAPADVPAQAQGPAGPNPPAGTPPPPGDSAGPPRGASTSPPRCPDAAPNVVCPMIYAPVVCKGCRYSNGCVAKAAGFDADKDCAKASPPQ